MIRESQFGSRYVPAEVDVVSRRWIERVPAGDGNRRPGRFLRIRVCSFAESSRVRRGVDGVVRGRRRRRADGRTRSALGRGGSFAVWSSVSRELWCCRTRGCACGGLGRSHETHSRRLSSFRKPHAHVQSPRGGRRACLGSPPKPTRGSRAFALAAPASRAIAAEALVAAVVCEVRPSSVRVPAAACSESCRDDGVRRRGVRHVVGEDRSRVGRGGSTSRVGPLARVVYAGKHLCGDRERDRRVQSLSRIALRLETRGASHPAPRVAL